MRRTLTADRGNRQFTQRRRDKITEDEFLKVDFPDNTRRIQDEPFYETEEEASQRASDAKLRRVIGEYI